MIYDSNHVSQLLCKILKFAKTFNVRFYKEILKIRSAMTRRMACPLIIKHLVLNECMYKHGVFFVTKLNGAVLNSFNVI